MKVLETQELESLKEINNKFNSLRNSIADNEISIKQLENNKALIFSELEKISLEHKEIEAILFDKYGKVSINLETGEIND
jgi:hypothetical protein